MISQTDWVWTNTGLEKAKEERGLPEGPEGPEGDEEAGDDEEGGMGGGVSKLSQKDRNNVDYDEQEQVITMVVMNQQSTMLVFVG